MTEETISYTVTQEQICSNDFQNIMAHQWLIANSACSTKIATETKTDNCLQRHIEIYNNLGGLGYVDGADLHYRLLLDPD